MAEPIVKNYVAITVDPVPRIFLLEEEKLPRRNFESCPIFHSWLRGSAGIIGIKFSSWMIKQGKLSTAEKSTVTRWNKSETDFEVFFGSEREYSKDAVLDDETGHAFILRLDKETLAICFPMHGSTLGKGQVESLTSSLTSWAPQQV